MATKRGFQLLYTRLGYTTLLLRGDAVVMLFKGTSVNHSAFRTHILKRYHGVTSQIHRGSRRLPQKSNREAAWTIGAARSPRA
jgi:hypothetical protein